MVRCPDERLARAVVRAAFAAVVCVTFVASLAHADPADRERARAKQAEGVKLLDAGDAGAALERFEEAYAIFESPKIQYNMGLAYGRLERHADAFRAFDRFLRETTEASQQVSHARQERERLAKRVAFVAVSCDVPGVEVVLDGRKVGLTPLADRMPVDRGPHEVIVRGPALGSQAHRFTAVAGETVDLRFDVGTQPSAAAAAFRLRDRAHVAAGQENSGATPGQGIPSLEGGTAPSSTKPGAAWWKRPVGYGLLAAGAAGLVGGAYWLLRGDGCASARPSGFECRTEPPNRVPGWALLGTGLGLAIGGGFVLYAGRETQVALLLAPGSISVRGTL